MKIDFCIPIKNEAEIIEVNILRLISYLDSLKPVFTWTIIGTLNNSTDESLEILKKLKRHFPGKVDYLECIHGGKGAAIKACWRNSSADILSFMDADLAVSLDSIPSLTIPLINDVADFVISSRFLPHSSVSRSVKRGIISNGYISLSKIILNHHRNDLQCGFKLIKKESFNMIESYLEDDRWFFDTELVLFSELARLRILEVPVKWTENRISSKKSNIKVFRDSYDFVRKLIIFRIRLKALKNIFVVTD